MIEAKTDVLLVFASVNDKYLENQTPTKLAVCAVLYFSRAPKTYIHTHTYIYNKIKKKCTPKLCFH